MTQGGPAGTTTTLAYYIYTKGFVQQDLGYAASVSWVLFAIVFALTLVNWKYGNRKRRRPHESKDDQPAAGAGMLFLKLFGISVLCGLMFLPFIWMICTAFKSSGEVEGAHFWPRLFSPDNIRIVLRMIPDPFTKEYVEPASAQVDIQQHLRRKLGHGPGGLYQLHGSLCVQPHPVAGARQGLHAVSGDHDDPGTGADDPPLPGDGVDESGEYLQGLIIPVRLQRLWHVHAAAVHAWHPAEL
jgi:hypothetical protein